MTLQHEVNELYKKYKKDKSPITIDIYSYECFLFGWTDKIEHKLEGGRWVLAKPPIPRYDIITETFRGYSHGISPRSYKIYYEVNGLNKK